MSKNPSGYQFNNIDENDPAVIEWMKQVIDRSESYKFIRMADDFHNVANYLNDIRVCFISVTITIYVVLVVWAIAFCVRRNRRNVSGAASVRRPRSQWDYQVCENCRVKVVKKILKIASAESAFYQILKRGTTNDAPQYQNLVGLDLCIDKL